MKREMKNVVLIVVFCMIAVSAKAVNFDSTSWENKYECDVLPTEAGWVAANSRVLEFSSVADGILTLNSLSGDGSWYGWYTHESSFDFSTGATFEIRTRLLDGETDGYASAILQAFDGSHYADIGFDKSGTSDIRAWSMSPGSGEIFENGLDQWHTFRVTVKDGEGIKWYLGDDLTPIHYGSMKTSTSTGLRLGDLTGGADSNWEIDYIRWTDQGAIAVPEPSSVGLLIAGLMFIRKRK